MLPFYWSVASCKHTMFLSLCICFYCIQEIFVMNIGHISSAMLPIPGKSRLQSHEQHQPFWCAPVLTYSAFFGKRLSRDKHSAASYVVGYGKSNHEDDVMHQAVNLVWCCRSYIVLTWIGDYPLCRKQVACRNNVNICICLYEKTSIVWEAKYGTYGNKMYFIRKQTIWIFLLNWSKFHSCGSKFFTV
jgi:hypothetical protein